MSFFRIIWDVRDDPYAGETMAKKLQRQFRNRNLTPEEVAHDEEVRRKVTAEFPPARPRVSATPYSLSEALKQAIRESDKSEYQIAHLAGVSQIVISRFLSGERDIRMVTADKLADALGLQLGIGVNDHRWSGGAA